MTRLARSHYTTCSELPGQTAIAGRSPCGDFVRLNLPSSELAATKLLKFTVFPFILVVVILLSPTDSSRLLGLLGDASTSDCHILVAQSCVMLC